MRPACSCRERHEFCRLVVDRKDRRKRAGCFLHDRFVVAIFELAKMDIAPNHFVGQGKDQAAFSPLSVRRRTYWNGKVGRLGRLGRSQGIKILSLGKHNGLGFKIPTREDNHG